MSKIENITMVEPYHRTRAAKSTNQRAEKEGYKSKAKDSEAEKSVEKG